MYDYQLDQVFIEDKWTVLEDRSKRNNIRIDGVKERSMKTGKIAKNELDTIFKERLGME